MSTSQALFPPPGVIPRPLDVRLKDPGRHPTGRGFFDRGHPIMNRNVLYLSSVCLP